MNHNILNKIVEAHIQNRIREREDKIYAYQFRILGCDSSIKIVATQDRKTLRQIIIKYILKNEGNILHDLSTQCRDKSVPLYLGYGNDYPKDREKMVRVISSDRRIYGLFEDYIDKKIEEEYIMVVKYI